MPPGHVPIYFCVSPLIMYKTLEQQYLAAFTMLLRVVETCPDGIWTDKSFRHQTWHIAYHALFYADLYSCVNHSSFKPRCIHVDGCHSLDFKTSRGEILVNVSGYEKRDIVAYAHGLIDCISGRIVKTKLDDDSGFPWIEMNKLGLHIYNIRHIQHHMAQLNERVTQSNGIGVGWVGKVG